jgi:hypothetical protein
MMNSGCCIFLLLSARQQSQFPTKPFGPMPNGTGWAG